MKFFELLFSFYDKHTKQILTSFNIQNLQFSQFLNIFAQKENTMSRFYTEEQKEKRREQKRLWYQNNKIHVSEYNKGYSKKYREENREVLLKKKIEYYKTHSEIKNEYMKRYNVTQIGRAANLASSYKQMDKLNNVGETTVTKEWIVENIFAKTCIYCGESDWSKLGCDRKDNSLPHTPDNCVPCCWECNRKKGNRSYEEYMKKILGNQIS